MSDDRPPTYAEMRDLLSRQSFGDGFANENAELASDVDRPTAIQHGADTKLVRALAEDFAQVAKAGFVRYLLQVRPEYRPIFTDEYLAHLGL